MTIDFFRRNSLMISVISLIISFVALFVLVYYNLAQGPLVLKRCQVEQGTLLTPYTKAILEAQNCKPEEIEVIVRRSSNTVLVSQTATDAVAPTKSDEYTPDEFPNTVLIYDANGVSTIDRKLKYFGYDTDKGGNNNISLLSVGDNSSTTVSLLSDYYKGRWCSKIFYFSYHTRP
ncbi:MAG: hypothetical protein US50_C0016G0010 [Candidatus Nomurabacteria bacterium GW2011_GWB1_37_5]|uniref:Uncharacterized protein n=1 Tax=Candidatus Nomurabacteria bacterium GW2011_GWB1_37_5 TaxID=1618742 RepID=A0A0G0HA14_9BACT|nr:MAG: hypothetical protein US50_C0016G0010 [Candidatus Nomurabacteria bacterium GW2011_GWB1_37_5]